MSQPKKRKSDIHIDVCARDTAEHQSKKEKHWFEETEQNGAENRRSSTSIFKGLFKKMKSSTSLKITNKTPSSSKLESIANETQLSINSESSVTSAESGPSSLVPNIAKNAVLRTFVNRDSFTPVPPPDSDRDTFVLPTVGGSKQESTSKMEDSISVSSHMSIDTLGSNHTIDEDSISIGSTSAFCTPSRNPLHRNGFRMSTRSVPDRQGDDDMPPALFRSLCNSVVRRVPTSKSEGGSTPMRRSMRMSIQKRNLSAKSMEDVPEEEEALTASSRNAIKVNTPIEEEDDDEHFGGAKEFFDKNVTSHDETADEGTASISRLSTASESRMSCGSHSIGRKSSIFRKIFPGKTDEKERRMSEVFHNVDQSTSSTRRDSIVSFTNDCSFTGGMVPAANTNASITSLASNDSPQKAKLRKKAPSTSNLTQRLSSVFRRSSSSAVREEDFIGPGTQSTRRNTLTGFSSISSGIGSIASGVSDQGYGTIGSRNGHSISRNGSKRDDENKRERSRRLLDRIIISEIPAGELIKMKIEQQKKKNQNEMNEEFETQLNEPNLSNSSQNEYLNFDVVAVDLKPDGSPFSTTAAAFIDEGMGKMVKDEMRSNFRPDRCGSITDCEPELVFVIPEQPQCTIRGLNDSIASNADFNSDLLRNVRSGLCKSVEEWKKISVSRNSSTMLIYPMFCQSEEEWDSKATIDAIFLMLDGILMSPKRWRQNGKCILAGVTSSNVRLLRDKFDELKQSVTLTESDGPISSVDDLDTQSITSTSTVFGTKI